MSGRSDVQRLAHPPHDAQDVSNGGVSRVQKRCAASKTFMLDHAIRDLEAVPNGGCCRLLSKCCGGYEDGRDVDRRGKSDV